MGEVSTLSPWNPGGGKTCSCDACTAHLFLGEVGGDIYNIYYIRIWKLRHSDEFASFAPTITRNTSMPKRNAHAAARRLNGKSGGRPPIAPALKRLCSDGVPLWHAGPKALYVERPNTGSEALRRARDAWAAVLCLVPLLRLKTGTASYDSAATDYGGQSATHNYDLTTRTDAKGFAIVGALANDKPDRKLTKACKHWMELVIALQVSLCCTAGFVLAFTRFMVVRGARTLPHTDTWRDGSPSAMRLMEPGGQLVVDLSISFRRSLCHHPDVVGLCMPLMLTGAHLLVIMWVDGLAVKHTLPPASWLQLEQVYFLSVLVVGTTKGEAVTAPVFDAKRADATLLSSTKQCTRMSLEAILEGAQLAACKPGTYMVALGSTERWDLLYGFMHVHWWVGEHDIYRVHAFNCRCRQVQPMLETPLDPMPYLAIQLTHPAWDPTHGRYPCALCPQGKQPRSSPLTPLRMLPQGPLPPNRNGLTSHGTQHVTRLYATSAMMGARFRGRMRLLCVMVVAAWSTWHA